MRLSGDGGIQGRQLMESLLPIICRAGQRRKDLALERDLGGLETGTFPLSRIGGEGRFFDLERVEP